MTASGNGDGYGPDGPLTQRHPFLPSFSAEEIRQDVDHWLDDLSKIPANLVSSEKAQRVLTLLRGQAAIARDALIGRKDLSLKHLDALYEVLKPEGQGTLCCRPLRKILIANRSEIAIRVLRAIEAENKDRAPEERITPIMVYAPWEAKALHVRQGLALGGEAYELPAAETKGTEYSNIDAIVAIAKAHGADGIHPGYGFQSERSAFARPVIEAGIAYIGPTPEALDLGGKDQTKKTLQAGGSSVIPGTGQGTEDFEDLVAQMRKAGMLGDDGEPLYTVRMKVAEAGGGRGQDTANTIAGMKAKFQALVDYGRNQHSDGRVIAEKNIPTSQHLEGQLLVDRFGNAVIVSERECTLQAGKQKLQEYSETTLFGEHPGLREAFRRDVAKAAQAFHYVGAGTVEALAIPDEGRHHIMEINARIQVEHVVSEMVSGIDIVREQLRIAEGRPLSRRQSQISLRGQAVEIRLKAVDPVKKTPQGQDQAAPGVISHFSVMGREGDELRDLEAQGIRVETGVSSGDEASPYGDPMFAKIVVWVDDVDPETQESLTPDQVRGRLIDKTLNVLRSTVVERMVVTKDGKRVFLPTDLERQIALLESAAVRAGTYDNRFVPSWEAAGWMEPAAARTPASETWADVDSFLALPDRPSALDLYVRVMAATGLSQWLREQEPSKLTERQLHQLQRLSLFLSYFSHQAHRLKLDHLGRIANFTSKQISHTAGDPRLAESAGGGSTEKTSPWSWSDPETWNGPRFRQWMSLPPDPRPMDVVLRLNILKGLLEYAAFAMQDPLPPADVVEQTRRITERVPALAKAYEKAAVAIRQPGYAQMANQLQKNAERLSHRSKDRQRRTRLMQAVVRVKADLSLRNIAVLLRSVPEIESEMAYAKEQGLSVVKDFGRWTDVLGRKEEVGDLLRRLTVDDIPAARALRRSLQACENESVSDLRAFAEPLSGFLAEDRLELLAVLPATTETDGPISQRPSYPGGERQDSILPPNGEEGLHGSAELFLKITAADGQPVPEGELREAFQKILDGNNGEITGPLAHTLARLKGKWSRLLGFEPDAGHQIVPNLVRDERGTVALSKIEIYEKKQPRATLMSVWRGDVPLVHALTVGLKDADAAAGRYRLELQVFDHEGRNLTGRAWSREVSLEKDSLGTASFFGEDEAALHAGILNAQGRTYLVTHWNHDEGSVMSTAKLDADEGVRAARHFEDLIAVIPQTAESFRRVIERELESLFLRVAALPDGHESRVNFICWAANSPFPIVNPLLRFLRPTQVWPPETRRLAVEILFLRPIVINYRRYRTDGRLENLEGGVKALTVGFQGGVRTFYHHVGDHIGPIDALRQVLKAIKKRGDSSEDATIQIAVTEEMQRAWRVARSVIKNLRTKNADGDLVTDWREIADWLEEELNQELGKKEWKGLHGNLWRLSFVFDQGEDQPPFPITLRNRERYFKEPQRSGYRTELPGERAFAVDPVLFRIDPMRGTFYGLDRLGDYPRIEALPALIPFPGRDLVVLLLHGKRDRHYYLASRVGPTAAVVRERGDMDRLRREHRLLCEELRAQFEDPTRWSSKNPPPEWNRLRFYLQGRQTLIGPSWQERMTQLARATQGDRSGLDIERVVIDALHRVERNGERFDIQSITTVEDHPTALREEESVRIQVRYRPPDSDRLVEWSVLERMLREKDWTLKPGERSWPADEGIKDKTAIERRRTLAQRNGGIFIYDQIQKTAYEAGRRLWAALGGDPANVPDDVLHVVGEYVLKDGRLQLVEREPGQNETGIAAVRMRIKTPDAPEGRDIFVAGHDRTHKDTRGAVDLASGRFLGTGIENAVSEGMGVLYVPESGGAMMALPPALLPVSPQGKLKVSLDRNRNALYLTKDQMNAVLSEMRTTESEIFIGRWETMPDGEQRFYFSTLLKGGVNTESLRGSAASAGAMARAGGEVRTVSLLLFWYAMGIALYLHRLARDARIQGRDAYPLLTGAEAINEMELGSKAPTHALFFGPDELAGPDKMLREGMSTQLTSDPVQGWTEALRTVLKPIRPAAPVPDIRKPMTIPGLPRRFERNLINAAVYEASNSGERFRQAVEKSKARVAAGKLGPLGSYDTWDELEALFDPGSFVRVKGKSHHAVIGYGTRNGWPVFGWGVQMLPEFEYDEQGKKIKSREIEVTDRRTRRKVKLTIPAGRPGGTLYAEAAAEIASALEALPPWMAVLSDPAAGGYVPKTVAESGEHGARLASALARHPAAQIEYLGPKKEVLGGMHVTIAPELAGERGNIFLYAHPTATDAVLKPGGWKGIGFYKSTVQRTIEQLRAEPAYRDLSPEDVADVAGKIVLKVVESMSTIQRAKSSGSITDIADEKKIASLIDRHLEDWYTSPEFRKIHDR